MKQNNNNDDEYHLYYRRNGFIVPYPEANAQFWSYITRRTLAFFFDNMLFVLMTLILKLILGFNIWTSMLMGVGINFIYILTSTSMKHNRSLGMIIARLRIGSFEGLHPSGFQIIGRAVLSSFVILPFVGWFLMLFNIISILMTKGLSPVDLMSKTQVFDEWKLRAYIDINENTSNI